MTSAIPVQRSNQLSELSSQLGAGHLLACCRLSGGGAREGGQRERSERTKKRGVAPRVFFFFFVRLLRSYRLSLCAPLTESLEQASHL